MSEMILLVSYIDSQKESQPLPIYDKRNPLAIC